MSSRALSPVGESSCLATLIVPHPDSVSTHNQTIEARSTRLRPCSRFRCPGTNLRPLAKTRCVDHLYLSPLQCPTSENLCACAVQSVMRSARKVLPRLPPTPEASNYFLSLNIPYNPTRISATSGATSSRSSTNASMDLLPVNGAWGIFSCQRAWGQNTSGRERTGAWGTEKKKHPPASVKRSVGATETKRGYGTRPIPRPCIRL